MPDPNRLREVPVPYNFGGRCTIATPEPGTPNREVDCRRGGKGASVVGRVVRAWTACVSLAVRCVRHPVTDESRLSFFFLPGQACLLAGHSALPCLCPT
jgi:hypothetical protein